jgi:hypothetical protein
VSHFFICFYTLSRTRIIFLTLTRLVVVINFVNFSFALFTPSSTRLSDILVEYLGNISRKNLRGVTGEISGQYFWK